jgi:RNA polymerase sigma-70 factor (ECF subfamily)
MTPEEKLLREARQLDDSALAEIYDLYNNELYRYALRLLGDVQLSEDCVMDTFNRFLNALHRGGGPDTYLRAYLYRTAHNWITDLYRRRTQSEAPLDQAILGGSDQDPAMVLQEKADQEMLRTAMIALTPDQRFVITLKFLEGWSNEEISAAIGKRVGAVKALQHRAIEALQRSIKVNEGRAR